MKLNATLIGLGLVASCFSQTVRLSRHFTAGDSDSYKLHLTGTSQIGDFDLSISQTQKIVKVYPDGGADMETDVNSMSVTMGGNEVPVPQPKPTTMRVDKFGAPVQQTDNPANKLNFAKFAGLLFDHDLTVGNSITVNQTSPDGKEKTTGTIKVDSVANNDVKLVADVILTSDKMDTPMKIHMTTLVNTNNSKVEHIEGTVDSMPIQAGMNLTDVKMTYDHVS
jgi:hypothetical protein